MDENLQRSATMSVAKSSFLTRNMQVIRKGQVYAFDPNSVQTFEDLRELCLLVFMQMSLTYYDDNDDFPEAIMNKYYKKLP